MMDVVLQSDTGIFGVDQLHEFFAAMGFSPRMHLFLLTFLVNNDVIIPMGGGERYFIPHVLPDSPESLMAKITLTLSMKNLKFIGSFIFISKKKIIRPIIKI